MAGKPKWKQMVKLNSLLYGDYHRLMENWPKLLSPYRNKNEWTPKRIPSRIGVPRKWQCSVPEDRLKSGLQYRDPQGTYAWCPNVSWEVCPFSPEDPWGTSLLAPKMPWRTQLFSPPSSWGGESLLPKIQPWPSTEALDTTLPQDKKISGRCSLNLVPKELPHRRIRGVPQNKAPEGGSFVIDGRETLRKGDRIPQRQQTWEI